MNFTGDPYLIAAATTIPILLLAVTLEGDLVSSVMTRAYLMLATESKSKHKWVAAASDATSASIALLMGYFALIGIGFAFDGEFVAFWQLDQSGTDRGSLGGAFIFVAVAYLVLMVAVEVVARIWRAISTERRRKKQIVIPGSRYRARRFGS